MPPAPPFSRHRENCTLELVEGPGTDGFEGESVGDIEVPAGDSAEGCHDGTTTKLMTDIRAERADICAFGTVNAEGGVGKIDGEQLEGEDGDFAWFPLDGDALAGQFIEWLAVFLDGRDHGGNLLLKTNHALNSLCQHFFCNGFGAVLGGHGAGGIFGICFDTQAEGSLIDLGLAHQGVLELCRLAKEENQETRGHGVERAAVADFSRVKCVFDAVHYIKAGPLLPFVRQKDAVDVISYLLCHYQQGSPCPAHR